MADRFFDFLCGFLVFALCAMNGCAASAPEKLHAQVTLSADCEPVGDYRLYSSRGAQQASGQYENGQRYGQWSFWDSHGTKIVELMYVRGLKQGAYQMWYGSFAFPSSAGRKKEEGNFELDLLDGTKRSWFQGGEGRCDTKLRSGTIVGAQCWTEDGQALPGEDALIAAHSELEADMKYLRTLDEVVQDSVSDLCRERRDTSSMSAAPRE